MEHLARDQFAGGSMPRGEIIAIEGSVVDVRFPTEMPAIEIALIATSEPPIIIEVAALLDDKTVRGIVFNPSDKLQLGLEVISTGERLKVPVGEGVLGRVLDVFGEAIDGKGALEGVEYRPIRGTPVSLPKEPLNNSPDMANWSCTCSGKVESILFSLPPAFRTGRG